MTKDDRYGAAGDTYGSSGDEDADSDGSENSSNTPSTSRNGTGSDAASHRERRDESAANGSDQTGVADLPFIFARRTVKADRNALPVYVRDSTANGIDELERELDERFDGDDVMSLDVREAVVKAGLRNVDDVVDVMEAWGYGRR